MAEFEVIIKQEIDNDSIDHSQICEDDSVNAVQHSRQKDFELDIKGRNLGRNRNRNPPSDTWHKCQLCGRVYDTTPGCHSHIAAKHSK